MARRSGRVAGRNVRRCFVPGCGRRVRPGDLCCPAHTHTKEGQELGRAVATAAKALAQATDGDAQLDATAQGRRKAFLARIGRGEFGGLLDEPFRAVLGQAAEEEDLRLELGSLRVALTRVLMEEADAAAMALGVSRLARTAVLLQEKRAKLRQGMEDAEFMELWDEIEAEGLDLSPKPWELQEAREIAAREQASQAPPWDAAEQAERDREALARKEMERRLAYGTDVGSLDL